MSTPTLTRPLAARDPRPALASRRAWRAWLPRPRRPRPRLARPSRADDLPAWLTPEDRAALRRLGAPGHSCIRY